MLNSRLVEMIVLKGALPDGRFTDEEILSMTYDCLLSELVPLIISLREEFYVKSEPAAMAERLRMPRRALGNVLRHVFLVRNGRRIPIYRLGPEEITTLDPAQPHAFYIEGNDIVLHPTPPSGLSDTVERSFFFRPSLLVPESQCGKVTNVNYSTGAISLGVPSGWTTGPYDIITQDSGHECLTYDSQATVVPGQMTFAPAAVARVRNGDYIAKPGTTPWAQIPDEAFSLLAQLAVIDCLEEMGSLNEKASAEAKVNKLKAALVAVLSQRVQGAPQRFRTSLR